MINECNEYHSFQAKTVIPAIKATKVTTIGSIYPTKN